MASQQRSDRENPTTGEEAEKAAAARKRDLEDGLENPSYGGDAAGTAAARKKRRRWPWIAAAASLVLLLSIALAPWIVAHSPLLNWLASRAVHRQYGSLEIEAASLGWFSPVELEGIDLFDGKGEPLAHVHQVRCSRTLWQLLRDSTTLGVIDVEQPDVQIAVYESQTNLEQFLAPWLQPSESDAASIEADIRVVGGKLTLSDHTTGRRWFFGEIEGACSIAKDPAAPLAATLSAVETTGPTAARIDAKLSLPRQGGAADVKLATKRFPAMALHGLLARFAPGVKLSGRLTSDMKLKLGGEGAEQVALAGSATIEDLALDVPQLAETLRLERLEVPGDVTLAGRRLNIRRLAVTCDAGHLDVHGALDLNDLDGEQLVEALIRESYTLKGAVDLARLAAILPKTLSIRADTRVTSGELAFDLVSEPSGDREHRWQGTVAASNLSAESDGRRFRWDRPVKIEFDALAGANGLAVDRLHCDSDFLQIEAAGSPEQVQGTLRFDLAQLAGRLEQFVDLSGWRIAGRGQGNVNWSRGADNAFATDARFDVTGFQLAMPDAAPWLEPALSVHAEAAGTMEQATIARVASGRLRVIAEGDGLDATLRDAVENPGPASAWPLHVKLHGKIGQWKQRLTPWIKLDELELGGVCEVTVDGTFAANSVAIETGRARVDQFAWRGYGIALDEPSATLALSDTSWAADAHRVNITSATAAAGGVELSAEKLLFQWPENAGPELSGKVAFRGKLENVQRAMLATQARGAFAAGDWQIEGEAEGQAQFAYHQGMTTADLTATGQWIRVHQYAAGPRGRTERQLVWNEPEVGVKGKARYDRSADRLSIDSAQATSRALNLTAAGKIEKLLAAQEIDVAGAIDYDAKQMAALLAAYLGTGATLEGGNRATFALRGPLTATPDEKGQSPAWSQRLAGRVETSWNGANLYGLEVGKAKLAADLGAGRLTFAPLDVEVSEGRLTSAPLIQFEPAPYQLYLPKGPLVSQVRISPEISDLWLKFVAPVLAEATKTDGKFSVELAGGRIPLAAPEQGDVAGRLNVHKVEVLPGPLAQEFLLLGDQIEAVLQRRPPPTELRNPQQKLVTLQDQEVMFRLVEGRVYHEGLKIDVAGTTVTTRGSVGLDQSLSLVATVPFADRWLGREPLLQTFRGKTLEVPIAGTLSRPQLDRAALRTIIAQLGENAAQGLLQRGLEQGLNRLFPQK